MHYHTDKMQLFELHSSEMAVFKIMCILPGYGVFCLNAQSLVGPYTPPLSRGTPDQKQELDTAEVVWCDAARGTRRQSGTPPGGHASPIQTFSGDKAKTEDNRPQLWAVSTWLRRAPQWKPISCRNSCHLIGAKWLSYWDHPGHVFYFSCSTGVQRKKVFQTSKHC